jgi:imidazolonepropionase-like amidohydrolase
MKQLVAFLLVLIVVASIFVIPTGYCEEIAPVVLFGGTLIDGTGADPVSNAVIVIERDRISAVGAADTVEVPDDATKIQLRGATLLPGLINAHVHQAYNCQNLQAWAQAGVTTVRDMASTDMVTLNGSRSEMRFSGIPRMRA